MLLPEEAVTFNRNWREFVARLEDSEALSKLGLCQIVRRV